MITFRSRVWPRGHEATNYPKEWRQLWINPYLRKRLNGTRFKWLNQKRRESDRFRKSVKCFICGLQLISISQISTQKYWSGHFDLFRFQENNRRLSPQLFQPIDLFLFSGEPPPSPTPSPGKRTLNLILLVLPLSLTMTGDSSGLAGTKSRTFTVFINRVRGGCKVCNSFLLS